MRFPPDVSSRKAECPSQVRVVSAMGRRLTTQPRASWLGRTFRRSVRCGDEPFGMSSRLLAPGIALTAVLADASGVHGLASWLVLLPLPAAGPAAVGGPGAVLGGQGRRLRARPSPPAPGFLLPGSPRRAGGPLRA